MAQRHRIAISASRRTCFFHTFAAVHYTLELTLDKKKFLFVSLDALIADIAWQVVKEGHEVKLFIESKDEREIADGFVPKTDDWVRDVPWADVVVFDDVLGQGAKAQQLRQTGKLVVGGSPYTDQLEDDRAFGQQELKRPGWQSSRRKTSIRSTTRSRSSGPIPIATSSSRAV